jgi:hypothetical protein
MPRPGKKVFSSTLGRAGTKAYIRCQVENGMFNHEKIASITLGDVDISVIVDEQAVQKSGLLQVHVYGKKGNTFLIGLPGETFSSSRKMWVDQGQLQLQ